MVQGCKDLHYILSDWFLWPSVRPSVQGKRWTSTRSLGGTGGTRRAFRDAMTTRGASWAADRRRVTAVGRYLGQRVVAHAGRRANIDRAAAARASAEVERGCQMKATREALLTTDCTNPAVTTFSS